MTNICTWTYDPEYRVWDTECGIIAEAVDQDDETVFCPYCERELERVK